MKNASDEPTPPPPLIERCSWLLEQMYDERRAIFSHSTRLVGGAYVNDFDGDGVIRYTVNTLAGIERAARFHTLSWPVGEMIESFVARRWNEVLNPGDRGLLLALLASVGHDRRDELFRTIVTESKDRARLERLNVQELCWLSLGTTALAGASGREEHRETAGWFHRLLVEHYMNRRTALPSFGRRMLRRRFTSFGGVAYALTALYEYGRAFGDSGALDLFRRAVSAVVALQGEMGEWPWFIDAERGRVLDWYQVYSVHQDAMALLFLLPACDLGVPGAVGAVEASYRWLFGANELREPMIVDDPFFIYRSIRRVGPGERERRLVRSLALAATGGAAGRAVRSRLEINTECRSYHPGWILYVWAGRTDFPEFTGLRLLA